MARFESIAEEFKETQQVALELLQEVSSGQVAVDAHSMLRLNKLAVARARLAYSNGLESSMTDSVRNLIAWCDHLDEPSWRSNFEHAIKNYPLSSPFSNA